MDWFNRFDLVRDKIKMQLTNRGVDNLAELEKHFQELDVDSSGKLDSSEFEHFLAKIGVFLTKQELRAIYNVFDPNFDRLISFQEFLAPLKKDMNNARVDIVKQAFQALDVEGKGCVPLEEVLKRFNPAAHPRIATREKTVEQVSKEFADAMSKKAVNGMITFEAFMDYYQEINATLPTERDAFFMDLVIGCWNLTVTEPTASGKAKEKSNEKEKSEEETLLEYIASLESLIYEKIRQRTNVKEDEGRTMKRAINYVDTANIGAVNFQQFTELLVDIGCRLKLDDAKLIFEKFADPESNKVHADKFANYFALIGAGNNPNVKPKFRLEPDFPKQPLNKIRELFMEMGGNEAKELEALFKRVDKSGSMKVNRHEFAWILRENGHRLLPLEFERIFKYFDKNHDDVISYEEFMQGLRGELNERRKQAVSDIFRALDVSGAGKIPLTDLVHCYRVEANPKFTSGKMTKKELIEEFISRWGKAKESGVVTLPEFEGFYFTISALTDSDENFENLLKNTWNVPEAKETTENKKTTGKA